MGIGYLRLLSVNDFEYLFLVLDVDFAALMAAPRLPAWTRPSFTWMDQAPGMRLKAAMPEKTLASRPNWLAFPTKVGNRAFSQVVPFPYVVLCTTGPWTHYPPRRG